MNFPLKNVEQYLPDFALILGEQLLAEGFVGKLKEAEAHLWTAKVVDKEVEIQISPTKVKAYTCECAVFGEKKICEHIAALLLALRRKLQKQKIRRISKPKRSPSPKRLSIAAILDNVSQDQLYSFLKAYSKTNRHFSLALKTRFAAAVPMEDVLEKYRQLLEASIKGHRLKSNEISFRGHQQLMRLCKELLGQADDALALENYQEAAMILQSIIEKMTPVIKKTRGDELILKGFVDVAFQKMEELLKAQPAPDLREVIWEFCLQNSTKSTYRINGMSEYFFQLMHQISDDNEKVETLLQSIDNELIKKTLTENYRANLLILKLNLLSKKEQKDVIETFINQNLKTPDFLLFVIQKFLDKEDFMKAKSVAKKGLKQSFSNFTKLKIEAHLLTIALHEKNQKKTAFYAERQFFAHKDFLFYRILKKNYVDTWEEKVEDILVEIKKMPFSMKKRDVWAQVFVEEKRWKDLLNYVANFKSIDLLQQHDLHLSK